MVDADLVTAGLKTFALLCVVLGILILVVYGMKKLSFFQEGVIQNGLINIVSSVHLAPRQRILLIDVAGEKILVGVTQDAITFLTKIEDPQSLKKIHVSKSEEVKKGIFRIRRKEEE